VACARRSRWRVDRDEAKRPSIVLDVDQMSYDVGALSKLAMELYAQFRRTVETAVTEKSIFHYLEYCVGADSEVTASAIAHVLDARTKALLDAAGNPAVSKYLVYRPQLIAAHTILADALKGAVEGLSQSVNHSDRFSISLLMLKKPADVNLIQDVERCRKEYQGLQKQALSGVGERDEELRRAEVYHIFRGELEAWYMERWAALRNGIAQDHPIPPRIVRILEDPPRLRAFVACLATGAITYDKPSDQWLWHGPGGQTMKLNEPSKGNGTVLRAATAFVLKGREGTERGLRVIGLADALRSVAEAAARNKQNERTLMEAFGESANLDAFLDEAFPPTQSTTYLQQREGLKLVLQFYASVGASTDLAQRMLPA
jgi:hypothetical protein